MVARAAFFQFRVVVRRWKRRSRPRRVAWVHGRGRRPPWVRCWFGRPRRVGVSAPEAAHRRICAAEAAGFWGLALGPARFVVLWAVDRAIFRRGLRFDVS